MIIMTRVHYVLSTLISIDVANSIIAIYACILSEDNYTKYITVITQHFVHIIIYKHTFKYSFNKKCWHNNYIQVQKLKQKCS